MTGTSTLTQQAGSNPVERTRDGEPAARRRWAAGLPAVSAVLAGAAAIAWHAASYGNWIVDDAAITFAYARTVAEGLGPVAQAGAEPVEGFSNPAWLLVLVLGRLVGLFDHGLLFGVPDYVLFPKAVALACCVGVLVAFHVAFREVTRRPWLPTAVSGLVLAAVPSFVIWTFSGLENALYALAVVWGAVLSWRAVARERLLSARVAVSVGALAALAALTRPEGMIYAGAYPLVVLLTLRRGSGRAALRYGALATAVFAVPVGSYVSWRYATFGRVVPNTAVAKNQDLPEPTTVLRVEELVGYVGAPLVLLAAAAVGVALGRTVAWRRELVALVVPLGFAVVAFVVLEPDWMGEYRFATPVWPLAVLTGVLAVGELLRGWGAAGRTSVLVLLVVALTASGTSFADSAERFAAAPTVPLCRIAERFGAVFNGYADRLDVRDGSVLLPDVGGTLLTTRLRVIDQAGLVDSRVAEFYGRGDMAALRDYVFDRARPTFIHSHGGWSSGTGIPSDPRMERDYYALYTDPEQGRSNADWVRKDAVPGPGALREARAYARAAVETVAEQGPRRHCGPVLRPGRTELGAG